MDVEIREPRPEDGEAVGRMHHASWVEAYAPLLQPDFFDAGSEARWIARWTANLARPDGTVTARVAVRSDGEVVGLASAGPSRPNDTAGPPVTDQELWSLHVRASEYGTGLASRLLEAVLPPGPAELGPPEPVPARREAA